MAVPDLLYQNEIENENGPYLRELGLIILSLTPDETEHAQAIKDRRPTLSLPDSFALLHEGLSKIVAHPRCRIPNEEVDMRLSRRSK